MDSHESNLESSSYPIYIWFWRNHIVRYNHDLNPNDCLLYSFCRNIRKGTDAKIGVLEFFVMFAWH